MKRKSAVPMEITFMDTKDNHQKYGTLRSLRYKYSNAFKFPKSSMGSPIFFPRIAKREWWHNMPPRQHIKQIEL
jgi:hypothetical protein